MRAGRRASHNRHVCFSLLLLALWTGIAPAMEQDSIADRPDWGMTTWSRSYIDGLDAAKGKDWKKALYHFARAFNEQRESEWNGDANPDAPQVWYNLALTMTHFPGYELRAAALFGAYLVKYPHSEQRGAIIRQTDQLLSRLDARIDLLRKEEERQYRIHYKQYEKSPEESKMGGAVIAKRFADQGDLAMAERHAARFESWMENNQDRLDNDKTGSYEWTGILRARVDMYESLIDAYVLRHNRNLASGRNIEEDLMKARVYYEKISKVYSDGVEKHPKGIFHIPFNGAPSRFMACDGRRNGYDFSMEYMKSAIYRHVKTDSTRDLEMVRFGIVEYRLRDFESAEKTFQLITDDALRNRWLQAARKKTPLTASQILGGFGRSRSWSRGTLRETAGNGTEENQTIACMDSDLEKERLLNMASMGIDLPACSVFVHERKVGAYPAARPAGVPTNGDVPASDLNVEKCLDELSKNGMSPTIGAQAYPMAIGEIADSLSRGRQLIRRYSEMYEAFP